MSRPETVLIRDIRAEEHAAVAAVLAEVYTREGVSDGYLEVVRDVASRAGAELTETLVALDGNGAVLGSCVLAHAGSPWIELARPGEAGLRLLGVPPSSRGRGVGARLVEECVARARHAGRTRLVLGTEQTMTGAHRLYERLGFTRRPERDLIQPSGRPLLVYDLLLEAGPLVREARPEEYGAIGELTVSAYAVDGFLAHDPDTGYAAELRDAKRRAAEAELLVAVDRTTDELLGTVTVCPDGSPYREVARPDEAEFRMLAVSPAARRRGVGETLTRAVLARTHASGRGAVAISSAHHMLDAHRLYRRLGFRRDESRDWTPVPEIELLCFRREV